MMEIRIRRRYILFLLTIGGLMLVALTPMAGMTPINLSDIFKDGHGTQRNIIMTIRLPRIALAFLAGSALSLGGMTFQSIFRNPLATPFTLGVASGASLGAAIALSANVTFSLLGISGITLCAFLGALFAVLLVYGLCTSRSVQGSSATLLAGIAVSFFFSSLNMFVQYISDFTRLAQIVRWLMGGLTTVGWVETKSIIWPVILCGAVIFYFSRELNLLSSGDEIAISRGMNVALVKKILFVAVSIMIGAVVATCGPIGFIGMMAPHMCRLLIGADHRFLAPASLMVGGTFLTLCDTVARTIIAPAEIPVGVITALVGGPFFLWLLLRKDGGKFFVLLFPILFLLAFATDSHAGEKNGVGSANSILESIDDMWRGKSSYAVMKMSIQTAHYKRELVMEGASLGKEKSLIVILSPKKEKGTATLKSGNSIYTYLPKTDRTIKLTSGMMMGSWMGSHLTNDDLVKESRMTDDYYVSIKFEGERNGRGEIDFVLDPKPDSAVVWGKIELTARKLNDGQYLPTIEKYYDEDGQEVRSVIFSGERKVDGRVLQTIMRVLPTDKPDEFTQLEYQLIKFDVKYTDDDFSLSRLRRSR